MQTFTTLAALAAVATGVSAHINLNFPLSTRNTSEQSTGAFCGGGDPVERDSDRYTFPLNNTWVSISSDAGLQFSLRYANSSEATSLEAFDQVLVSNVTIPESGNLCLFFDFESLPLSGQTGTLYFESLDPSGEEPATSACADVVFNSGVTAAVLNNLYDQKCTNGTIEEETDHADEGECHCHSHANGEEHCSGNCDASSTTAAGASETGASDNEDSGALSLRSGAAIAGALAAVGVAMVAF